MPSHPERSGVFGPVASPLTLLEALPTRTTTSDSVEHVRLAATGDAAQQVKEGDDIDGLLKLAVVMVTTLDSPADRIGETVTSMRTRGYNPAIIALNPTDWLKLTTSKDNEGGYLFGSPIAPAPRVLWNVPVVLFAGLPAGQALVLDTNHITILDREKPNVLISNSHKDYFSRNLIAILGELRAGLEVRDESAVMIVDLEGGD